jgi:hypothetical protein
MALRASFAAASLLGVVTTFGTSLWIAAVALLAAFIAVLTTCELLPRLQQNLRR